MTVGPSESMSKSKKNTIDPETMIKEYGADSVRWFILSDSPPEKDVQWSSAGVVSASKFLQKIWNLNQLILNREENGHDIEQGKKFESKINIYIYKIDTAIGNFQFNVVIAQFHEIYRLINDNLKLKLTNKILINNMIKIMKLMIPLVPHIAHECLSNLKCEGINKWPEINITAIEESSIKLVVQINGKTRDILEIKKDLNEEDINKLIKDSTKANKYLVNNKVIKTIFVKNKIINYITENK